MSADGAIARFVKLAALAAEGSGATEEEARTAAVAAVRLLTTKGLRVVSSTGASAHDAGRGVQADPLRLTELETLLVLEAAERIREQRRHEQELRQRDALWRERLHQALAAERKAARSARKRATTRAVRQTREEQARAGGIARNQALTLEQKANIARSGAAERWRRWREQRAERER